MGWLLPKIGARSSFAAFRALKGEPTLVTNSVSARYLITLLRIIHGELKPGTWGDYEEAYFEVIHRVEDLVCMDVTSPEISTIPMLAIASSIWEDEASMRAYETGSLLKGKILPRLPPFFSGRYVRHRSEIRRVEPPNVCDQSSPETDS